MILFLEKLRIMTQFKITVYQKKVTATKRYTLLHAKEMVKGQTLESTTRRARPALNYFIGYYFDLIVVHCSGLVPIRSGFLQTC